MSYPAYSVLLSVSNAEKKERLAIALDSMLNQTVKPSEIVLVQDGALRDELQATINKYKEEHPDLFNVLSMPSKVGTGWALRQGVYACSHGFIACMDSDGYSVPTRIEEEFNAMFENKVDMVGSNVNEFVGSTKNVVAHRMFPETPERIYKCAKKRMPMSHASVLFKKRMVVVCGNYENCAMAEDFALLIRLLNICAKGYNIQKPLVYKRLSEEFYKQNGGWDYFMAMISFNKKFYRIGWFTYQNYVVRSIANGFESFWHYAEGKRFMLKNSAERKFDYR